MNTGPSRARASSREISRWAWISLVLLAAPLAFAKSTIPAHEYLTSPESQPPHTDLGLKLVGSSALPATQIPNGGTMKVVLADYPLIKRDFPHLAEATTGNIDRWILETLNIQNELRITVDQDVLFPAKNAANETVGFLAVGNTGLNPLTADSDSHNYWPNLTAALRNFFLEALSRRALQGSPYRVLASYAVVDSGATARHADGSFESLGLYLHQAATGAVATEKKSADLNRLLKTNGLTAVRDVRLGFDGSGKATWLNPSEVTSTRQLPAIWFSGASKLLARRHLWSTVGYEPLTAAIDAQIGKRSELETLLAESLKAYEFSHAVVDEVLGKDQAKKDFAEAIGDQKRVALQYLIDKNESAENEKYVLQYDQLNDAGRAVLLKKVIDPEFRLSPSVREKVALALVTPETTLNADFVRIQKNHRDSKFAARLAHFFLTTFAETAEAKLQQRVIEIAIDPEQSSNTEALAVLKTHPALLTDTILERIWKSETPAIRSWFVSLLRARSANVELIKLSGFEKNLLREVVKDPVESVAASVVDLISELSAHDLVFLIGEIETQSTLPSLRVLAARARNDQGPWAKEAVLAAMFRAPNFRPSHRAEYLKNLAPEARQTFVSYLLLSKNSADSRALLTALATNPQLANLDTDNGLVDFLTSQLTSDDGNVRRAATLVLTARAGPAVWTHVKKAYFSMSPPLRRDFQETVLLARNGLNTQAALSLAVDEGDEGIRKLATRQLTRLPADVR